MSAFVDYGTVVGIEAGLIDCGEDPRHMGERQSGSAIDKI